MTDLVDVPAVSSGPTEEEIAEIMAMTVPPLEVPPNTSSLVTEAVARVTEDIKLDVMIRNMAITGDLLHLAKNSVPNKNKRLGAVRGRLSNMQDSYAMLCRESGHQMMILGDSSTAILRNVSAFYEELSHLKENSAILYLSACGDQAAKLSTAMGGIKQKFTALREEAREINLEANTAEGEGVAALQAKQDQIAKDKENEEAATDREKRHRELYTVIGTEYAQVSQDLSTEQDRAFGLKIASVIAGALSDAVGAGAAIYMQSQTGGVDKLLNKAASSGTPKTTDSTAGAEPDSKEKTEYLDAEEKFTEAESLLSEKDEEIGRKEKKLNKKRETYKEAKSAYKSLQNDVADLEDKISDLEEDVAKHKKNKDKKKERKAAEKLEAAKKKLPKKKTARDTKKEERDKLKGKVSGLEDALEDLKQGREELQSGLDAYKRIRDAKLAAFEGVKGALAGIADGTGQMSDDLYANVNSLRTRKTDLFKLMLEQRENELEAQSEAKRLVRRLERLAHEEVSIESMIRSIEQLINVVTAIISILGTAETFWQQMADACAAVRDDRLMLDIKVKIESGDYPDHARKQTYMSEAFRDQVLRYFARWAALRVVAEDFKAQTEGLGDKVAGQFRDKQIKGSQREDLVETLSQQLRDTLDIETERTEQEKTELLSLIDQNEAA